MDEDCACEQKLEMELLEKATAGNREFQHENRLPYSVSPMSSTPSSNSSFWLRYCQLYSAVSRHDVFLFMQFKLILIKLISDKITACT